MPMREYLGLSEIGNCARRVWYNHQEEYHLEPDPDVQNLMDMGSFLEPYVRGRRGEGVVTEDQREVKLGPAKGHIDGLMRDPDTGEVTLWESKATNGFSIRKWRAEGLPRYYSWQVQGYMAGLSDAGEHVTMCNLDALDRMTGKVETFAIMADPEVQKAVRTRADNLARALENGPTPNQEFPYGSPECNQCPYSGFCWGAKDGGTNAVVDLADAREWPGFQDALEVYVEAQRMAKQAKELEEEAKETILTTFKEKGAMGAESHGFVATHIWVKQDRFDQKLFHEKHPELWDKYKKPTKFPRLTVIPPGGARGGK